MRDLSGSQPARAPPSFQKELSPSPARATMLGHGAVVGSRIGKWIRNLFSLPMEMQNVKVSKADFPASPCPGSGRPTEPPFGGPLGWDRALWPGCRQRVC